MDGTDEDVLARMHEQAGSFETQSDRRDERVNDGNNYKGMMRAEDYKKRREEVLGGEQLAEQKKAETIANAVKADRAAAAAAPRAGVLGGGSGRGCCGGDPGIPGDVGGNGGISGVGGGGGGRGASRVNKRTLVLGSVESARSFASCGEVQSPSSTPPVSREVGFKAK